MYESRNIISGMVQRKFPDSKTRFLQVGVALAYLAHLYNEFLKSGRGSRKSWPDAKLDHVSYDD